MTLFTQNIISKSSSLNSFQAASRRDRSQKLSLFVKYISFEKVGLCVQALLGNNTFAWVIVILTFEFNPNYNQ